MSDLPNLSDDGGNKESEQDEPSPPVNQKKNKNNRKKRNKNSKKSEPQAASSNQEVERAVAEVNALLGEPAAAPAPAASEATASESAEVNAARALFAVNYKHLIVEDEYTRRFGPIEEACYSKRRQRPNVHNRLKRHIVMSKSSYPFMTRGLSMVLVDTVEDIKYFQFEHDPRYQESVHKLVEFVNNSILIPKEIPQTYQDNADNSALVTVEAVLHNADVYFMHREPITGCIALEGAIHLIQSVFCPSFNYYDGKSRLSYNILENRPFHIVLLKYLHVLTKQKCHRTSLEIGKILLNLDPTDPLGVTFIMDTIALKAREYQWLVDFYQYLHEKVRKNRMFHLDYSHALARYHLYLKSQKEEDLDIANMYLKEAVLVYPHVALYLLSLCRLDGPNINSHEIFNNLDEFAEHDSVLEREKLYVAFAGSKWQKGDVPMWLYDNVLELIEKYDTEYDFRMECMEAVAARYMGGTMGSQNNPYEIARHLFIIQSMSYLLIDSDVVPNMDMTYFFNPYFAVGSCVDENNYFPSCATAELFRAAGGHFNDYSHPLDFDPPN